ncbi:MAG TPA: type II toxin-antitoxin system ParD family antitoxin [Candidatus Binatia bacterium]|jgi:antitoxin ParD1/3/4
MNISLTKELEEFITSKVGSGRYLSASEVVRAGLRLLEHEEELLELQRVELRRAIAVGVGQLDRGEAVSGAEVFAKARKKLRARRTAAK